MKIALKDLTKYGSIYLGRKNRLAFLTFFITSKCNCKCRHCFYWKEINRNEDELTVEEIEKTCKTIGCFDKFSLTGGEPFIDPNMIAVTRLFYDINGIKHITVPTNGTLTHKVIDYAEEILKTCPELKLHIPVSLDGLERTHDEVRQTPGVFKKAVQTLDELNKLSRHFPQLIVGVTTSLSSFNQTEIFDIYHLIKEKLGVGTFSVLAIRGEPRENVTKGFDCKNYEKIGRMIQSDLLKKELKSSAHLNWVAAIEMLRYSSIYKSLKDGKYLSPCYAGRFNAILYRNGDVFPCELLDHKFGNVREVNYDFNKLWSSESADKIRNFIRKSKCACTHECLVNTNLIFNPKYLPKILYKYLKIKLGLA